MKRSMLRLPGTLAALILLLTWGIFTTLADSAPAVPTQEPAVVNDGGPQGDPGWQWVYETVDPSKTFDNMTDRSLVLDSAGRPQVVYGKNHLYYAGYDRGFWRWHLVDRSEGVGQFAAIVLDDADLPHISYYDETYGDLRYAHFDGSTWFTATVDSEGVVGQYTSIALDAGGNPHISYYDVSNSGLKYASFDGSAWTLSKVDDLGVIGRYTSLALDTSGVPHIAYYGAANLKYARLDGATWLIQTVDPSNLVGRYASLALDSANHPHISYFDEANHDLKYANYDGTIWSTAAVDVGAIGDALGGPTSLALDSAGRPYIAYFAPTDLKLAHFDGAAWQYENLPGVGSALTSISLDLDAADKPILAAGQLPLLRLYRFDGAAWQDTLVDCAGDTGTESSIVIDENDQPHFSYLACGGYLKYAAFDGLEWRMALVDTGGYQSALALDPVGYPHISYENNDSLKYAYYDGTGWQVEAVEVVGPRNTYYGVMPTSLGLDPDNLPHISYCHGTYGYCEMLKYAHFNGSTWISTTLSTSEGAGNSLAVDEAGLPHIGFAAGGVKYAFFDGGVWTISNVESGYGNMALALSETGLPRVIYQSAQRATRYATYDGATWHPEPALSANEVIYLHSLAVDSQGRPHFSYTGWTHINLDYRLWYAHQTDTGWQEEIILSGDTDNDLALDAQDRPHISTNNGGLLHIYQAPIPLSSASIEGPMQVGVNQDIMFAVTLAPVEAYEPITITWSNGATGPTAVYNWTQTGIYTISVSARNPVSIVSDTMTITVQNRAYLPIIQGPPLTGSMYGHVGESGSYHPIQGASVCVISSILCVITNADGYYSLDGIMVGDQSIRVSASGYYPQELTVTISNIYPGWYDFYLTPMVQTGSVSGQVISAVTAQGIGGASVCLVSGSPCVTADGSGNYTLSEVPTGAQTLRASAGGYTSLDQGVNVNANQTASMNFVLSPTLAQGEMRIVLTWGANPRDLDSHLWLPPSHPYHVYYAHRGNCTADPFACLDVDDQYSYGPETITIKQSFAGTYRYAVYKFAGDGPITASGAHVQVYDSTGLIAEYYVPSSGAGDWWYVFDLDGNTGAITVHDTIMATSPGPY